MMPEDGDRFNFGFWILDLLRRILREALLKYPYPYQQPHSCFFYEYIPYCQVKVFKANAKGVDQKRKR